MRSTLSARCTRPRSPRTCPPSYTPSRTSVRACVRPRCGRYAVSRAKPSAGSRPRSSKSSQTTTCAHHPPFPPPPPRRQGLHAPTPSRRIPLNLEASLPHNLRFTPVTFTPATFTCTGTCATQGARGARKGQIHPPSPFTPRPSSFTPRPSPPESTHLTPCLLFTLPAPPTRPLAHPPLPHPPGPAYSHLEPRVFTPRSPRIHRSSPPHSRRTALP